MALSFYGARSSLRAGLLHDAIPRHGRRSYQGAVLVQEAI
jgi:hypothetical protein